MKKLNGVLSKKTKQYSGILIFCIMLLLGQIGSAEILTSTKTEPAITGRENTAPGLNFSAFFTEYCVPANDGVHSYGIVGFSTSGGYNNISNMNNRTVDAYSDYSSLNVSQSPGGNITYHVTAPNVAIKIWIDFNQDFTFDEEELVGSGITTDATLTGIFTIPLDLPIGNYRIRIRSGYPNSPDRIYPCDFNYLGVGEAEDYTLSVITPSSCMPQTDLTATVNAQLEASISWIAPDPVPDSGYEYAITTSAIPPESGTATTETSVSVSELSANTDYFVHVRTNCGSGYSVWVTTSFYTGYCIPTGGFSNNRITGVMTWGGYANIYNPDNGTASAYNDYSDTMGVSQYYGGGDINYYITVPSSEATAIKIWIDFNQDFIFGEDELVVTRVVPASNNGVPYTGILTIPPDLSLGEYRMRIRSGTAGYPDQIYPCGDNFNGYGEAEDYTLSIVAFPPCAPLADLTSTVISSTEASISWTASDPAPDEGYEYVTTTSLIPPVPGTTTSTTSATSVLMSELTADTDYYVHVRANCGSGDYSPWTATSFHTGYCMPAGGSSSDERITGIMTSGGYTNISNPDNGTASAYNDYSDTMSVSQYYGGGNINFYIAVNSIAAIKIWIDFNRDYVFDEDELVAAGVANDNKFIGTLTLPPGLSPGDYRIRIRSGYRYQPDHIYPCGNNPFGSGEAEDYTLSIVAPPSCTSLADLTSTVNTHLEANISWAASDPAPDEGYEYVATTSAIPPVPGTIASTTSATSVSMSELTADTEYFVHVRANCGSGDYSPWAVTSFYTGYCMPTGGSSSSYRITGVSTSGGYTNISNPDNGTTNAYNDYSDTMSVSQYYGGGNINFYIAGNSIPVIKIWIDFNRDYVFDEDELIATGEVPSGDNDAPYIGILTLPPDLSLGDYRIRIRSGYPYQPDQIYPCGYNSPGVGEAEDYTLSIVAPPALVTWTGSTWVNGTPAPDVNVLIDGSLIIGQNYENEFGSLEVKDMTVSENGSIVINTEHMLKVNGALINNNTASNFLIETGANLIQDDNVENTGEITVQRESQPMVRLDYTLWSSPVINQNLFNFSPETVNGVTNYPGSTGRIYVYNGTNGYENPAPFDENSIMNSGTGYLFRSPNNFDAVTPAVYNGLFTGVPFNGDLSVATVAGSYTSVGNPYPSSIDANDFISSNPEISTLYFWNNNYSAGNNYATCVLNNCVAAAGGGNIPNGVISIGQGFIVATSGASVNFHNSMRTNDNANFFKVEEAERHRFWLNLNDDENHGYNQILISYMTEATNGIDDQVDGKLFGYEGSALYNWIDNNPFVIQGRALPFEASDVVPLGFKAVEAGKFNISLADFDGLFAEGETTIYLKDKNLNVIHNLMESGYSFESAAGEFNNRFEIVYQEEGTMGTDNTTSDEIKIYKDKDYIIIESKTEKIFSVELYDLNGRNIHRNNKVNANIYQTKSRSKGVLMIKVQTQNGKIVTKKIINK